jgi:hypothetical protein
MRFTQPPLFSEPVTGNSPNALAESLNQVSWALLFCGGWWMLWSFDHFFIPVEEKAKSTIQRKRGFAVLHRRKRRRNF